VSKAPIILSQFHNLSAGDLADEHGQLCAQIADLETRKRTIAGEAWIARFLKFSKRSAFVKTTARTGAVQMAA
jgi:hypothetical protein